MDEKYWQTFETLFVHEVYNETSYSSFDDDVNNHVDKQNGNIAANSRTSCNLTNPWKKVKLFLLDLRPYSLVADIGCGDGKYMDINKNIFQIGCDRCTKAIDLASNQFSMTKELLISDNLFLPFRSNLFDAVISIGVIHHFSTQARRLHAVKELCRILKPGGSIMIYVWAMEQKLRNFKSQDVLVPLEKTSLLTRTRHFSLSSLNRDKDSEKEDVKNPNQIDVENKQGHMKSMQTFIAKKLSSKQSKQINFSLNNDSIDEINKQLPKEFQIRKFPMSSYENTFNADKEDPKTARQLLKAHSTDHSGSKDKTTTDADNPNKRFYHVFKSNELDKMINDHCDDMIIYKSYYDHGNWCVCMRKALNRNAKHVQIDPF